MYLIVVLCNTLSPYNCLTDRIALDVQDSYFCRYIHTNVLPEYLKDKPNYKVVKISCTKYPQFYK